MIIYVEKYRFAQSTNAVIKKMSAHSPTIINGANGMADTSVTFGKSLLDGEVPYPADMAGLPSSTPNPSAIKKKTRRSWFETTPSGSRLEIAVEKPEPVGRKLSGEVEVLTLTHFTAAPRLDFGTMKPGQVKVCTLLLRNPHECVQNVKIEKVPEKKHFTVACKAFSVGPGETYPLEVTWSPPEPGNFREMILMQVDRSYRLQAYVFGSVTAPPQKKKKRIGLLASKVSKPFSVIQTSSLATINQQYSPEKNRRSGESNRPLTRRSGQGIQARQVKQQKVKPSKQTDTQCRNTKRLSGNKDKENLVKKDIQNTEDIKIPKKKMRRSNTYSNVSNQGLMIPVIQGDTVQGQMDTSLIEIVDKCNVSGIQPLEQSLDCLKTESNLNVSKKDGSATRVYENPSFLEKCDVSPDIDKIVSQIIPSGGKENNEPSFLETNFQTDAVRDCKREKVTNIKLEVLKQSETFHDSLENGEIGVDASKYQEQPSFLSPQNVSENARTYCLRRSARKSAGRIDNDTEGVTTEVKLLKSVKRRSGRRSITKERRRSSLNKSAGSKSVLDQLKSLRTFIKEKSFEIESGDESSCHKPNHKVNQLDYENEENEKENLHGCTQSSLPGITKTNDLQKDTFLADSSKMKLLESQKPSEASPRRTTFTVLRRTQVVKSPARSKSEGHPQHNVLAALDEALNEAEDTNLEQTNVAVEKLITNEVFRESEQIKDQRRKSESPKRLYSADSLENDSFEPMITSPKQLKLENQETGERRMTLTVTKSRPSDALLYQMELQTAKLFQTVETCMECTNNDKIEKSTTENNRQSQANDTFEKTENNTNKSTPNVSFPSTPNQLPSSPNPDHSRRSTHIVKQPRIIDLSKIEQKELFLGKNESKEEYQLDDSPANNTRRRLSARHSISNNKEFKEIKDIQPQESIMVKENVETKVTAEGSDKNGLLFIPLDGKDKDKGAKDAPSRPKTVIDPKQFLRKRSNTVLTATSQPKRVKKENADLQKKPVAAVDKKASREPQNVAKTTRMAVNNRTAAGKKASTVKGLAQPKLILMKKSKTALPKHPLVFAAKNMYYDERWMEKQERGFVNWLNFILTPAEEYQATDVKVKVDAGKLTVDVAKGHVKLAPTNEVLSFRAYSAHRKLNRLRKSACRLFQSESVIKVIQKLEGEVESARLAVRKDRMLHADLGLKQKILDMLLSYNPLWLRIGIETIYGEVVPLQSNSDVFGLSRFILTRLLTNPDIMQEFSHPTVPHLYRDGYAEATAAHSLKKFLMLVYFLDRAKQERLIEHNPCLFCKNADVKKILANKAKNIFLRMVGEYGSRLIVQLASKDLLLQFSRDFLSGEGDITRHLGYLGYKVTYTQTALDEFDFAVSKLSTDLRDGLRLTRVLELLCNKPELSRTLRVPAISRLQKVHNVEVVFKALAEQNIDAENVVARDIVDGHREKTLKLLWNIILHYQVEILLNEDQLREEIEILEKNLKVKNQLQKFLCYSNNDRSKRDSEGPDLHTQNPRLNLLLKWSRAVCAFYNIRVENFTVSFSDGRALCHILHYYHPALLPLYQINNETSLTHLERMERNTNRNTTSSFNDSFNSSAAFGDTEAPEVYEALLNNEKDNFKVLFEKVKELGGIPLMLKWSDMSNTIPDEKVVVTYLLYLCARLLDIRHESRAARVIQLAWRNHRLRKIEAEFQLKNKAALVIQEHVRRFLARKRAERKDKAVLLIQSVWRGHRARKHVQQLKLAQVMLKQTEAVDLLQRAIMGFIHRKRYLKTKAAITKLQACCRGYLLRSKRHKAATRIQAAVRGHMAKKHFIETKISITKIQSYVRSYLVRRDIERYKRAVLTIQRRFRAYLEMKNVQRSYVCTRGSCILIQRNWRNYLAKIKRKQNCSALKIQTAFRGYLERKKYLNMKSSVTLLQAFFRGYKERNFYLRQKEAAISIQRYYRNCLVARQQQSEYQTLRKAATFLQAQRRMIVQKMKYENTLTCVVRAQATVRMFLEMRRFQKLKEAVCTIQKYCQVFTIRRQYLIKVGAVITLQAWFRGVLVRKEMKIQNRAAAVLQAYMKQVVERKRYVALKSVVIQCQRRVRSNIQGRIQKEQYDLLRKAAITIQKFFRARKCRQQYIKDRIAIVKAQKMVRTKLARSSYLKLRSAVLFTQRHYRAKKLGEKCRGELRFLARAANTIQYAYRGYRCRKDISKKHAAATVIQSHVKGLLQRQKYVRLRSVTINCQQKIRAQLAAKHQRIQFQTLRRAAIIIQKLVRGQRCRVSYHNCRIQIVKAQSVCRMFIERERFMKKKKAALILQQRYRAKRMGNLCQQRYNTAKQAALTIQSSFRGFLVRREFQKQKRAAVCIQRRVKGYCQRKKFLLLKKAVISVQRKYRAKKIRMECRERYMKQKSAALTIQRFYRGHQIRQEIAHWHKSAVVIQARLRGHLQHKQYLKLKHTVVVTQRLYRAKKTGVDCRQTYLKQKSAAMTVESFYRGHKVRKEIELWNKSATVIQTAFRGHVQQEKYKKLKHSVLTAQRIYRAKKNGLKCRQQFLRQKSAAITVQSYYRGYRIRQELAHKHKLAIAIQATFRGYYQRCRYLRLREAAKVCQRRFRAKLLSHKAEGEYRTIICGITRLQALVRGQQCRNMYKKICSARKIQSIYRMYKCRKEYKRIRKDIITCQAVIRSFLSRTRFSAMKRQALAACVLQQRWRARVLGMRERKAFNELKRSVKVIQMYIRATLQAQKERQKFLAKKKAAVVIQAACKGFIQRMKYREQQQAVIRLQALYRGWQCRVEYQSLKNSVITCQRRFRAKKASQHDLEKYQRLRKSTVKVQATWRGFLCRKQFQTVRKAVIKIQSTYRGYKQRVLLDSRRKAAIVLQKYWRAEVLCRKHVFEYHTMRDAAILTQKNYRAKVARKKYLELRKATVALQSGIRMWSARRQVAELKQRKQEERRVVVERFVRASQIHLAAIQIQRCYRNHCLMKVAKEKLHSVTLIQRWMRSRLQRNAYLKDRENIVKVQRCVKQWFMRRNTAAIVIQRAIKGWLGNAEDRRRIRAAEKIQAYWKGYSVRRRSTSKKLAAARKRVLEANASATEEKKLCNRTSSALDYLLKYKLLSDVLTALQHLEVATRLSWSCCERMVEVNAVTVLYRLIRSCNRSLPHMEIIKLSVDIMLNLAKYDKTRASLHEGQDSINTLVELMQIYREKGPIFIKTCTLLGIMSLDNVCKTAIVQEKKITEKLKSIYKLTERKHKVEENQRVTRARMNATFNTTLAFRSPVKKHKIKPDWALHKDKMKEIESPLKAINFVVTNLGLSVK